MAGQDHRRPSAPAGLEVGRCREPAQMLERDGWTHAMKKATRSAPSGSKQINKESQELLLAHSYRHHHNIIIMFMLIDLNIEH